MIFFADENFSYRAAQMLEIFDLENEVRHLRDHFPKTTADVEWISAVGHWQPVPVVLGGDGRILKNKVERRVLRDAGLSFVFLAGGGANLPWEIQAWKIIRFWPDIVRNVAAIREPTVFEVAAGTGKVRRIGETRKL